MNSKTGTRHKLTDLLLLFSLLDKSSSGRYKLSDHLGITLAKTRVLLNLLVDNSLGKTSGQSSGRSGTRLTKQGREISNKLKDKIELYFDQENYKISQNLIEDGKKVVLVLLNHKIKSNGIFERDLAVRSAADGAITLRKDENALWIFPDDKKTNADFSIKNDLGMNYSTAVLVFADKIGFACQGAASIACYHLEDDFIQIFSKYFQV